MSTTPSYRHSFKLNIIPSILYSIDRFILISVNNRIKVINFKFLSSCLGILNFSFIVNFLKFKMSTKLSDNLVEL